MRQLATAGWQPGSIRGGEFELALFQPARVTPGDELTVYIGGDGLAFAAPDRVSADPTGREQFALQLALADPAASALLGRPCYYGGARSTPCQPLLWTRDRYGPVVVASLVDALATLSAAYPGTRLTLVGYSGGGVLALLAARELEQVDTVVTVAAPLDTQTWTDLHTYTPLAADGNPASMTDWPARLRQWHLVGEADDNVPPAISASYLARTGLDANEVTIVRYPAFDHTCCWLHDWPAIMASIRAGRVPGP